MKRFHCAFWACTLLLGANNTFAQRLISQEKAETMKPWQLEAALEPTTTSEETDVVDPVIPMAPWYTQSVNYAMVDSQPNPVVEESYPKRDLFSDVTVWEDSIQALYQQINLKEFGLSYPVFRYGMIGFYALQQEGKLNEKNILSIIDFTKPSTEKRFYTIDLTGLRVVYNTYVSHGKNTGGNMATQFSNTVHSNQSSLGFYLTAETYIGSKGYSLRLDGMEDNVNSNMRERAVVMHNADYVSESWIKRYGRLGRSQGCPALPKQISKDVIDTIKEHTVIFAYYNDDHYLHSSDYLDVNRFFQVAKHAPTSNPEAFH